MKKYTIKPLVWFEEESKKDDEKWWESEHYSIHDLGKYFYIIPKFGVLESNRRSTLEGAKAACEKHNGEYLEDFLSVADGAEQFIEWLKGNLTTEVVRSAEIKNKMEEMGL